MNLAKKSVWCEICNRPIVLEQNYPQFRFKTRNKPLAEASDGRLIYCESTSGHLDAQSIMFDRAFEHHALATSSQSSECANMGDYGLVEFLEQDIDPNREAYDKSFADSSSDKLRGDAYEDLPVRNGLIGLDNLGNTCYMNSALQALSNCLAFTSFFLECSQFIESIIPNNSGASGASLTAASSNSTACLSISYMKLMREIWQKRNSKNKRQMASSISPSELVQAIKYFNAMFRGYSQHDSQEFILYLLDQLHEEMKRPLIPVLSKNNDQKKPTDNEEEEEEEEEEDGSEGDDSNADEDDRTVIQQGDQQQLKVARSDSSTLNDSVSKRPRKKSHHHHHHGNHGYHGNESNGSNLNESNSDHAVDSDESDSYETCGGGESAATSSELSDKLHFSDVEESPHSSMSFDCPADDQAPSSSSMMADAQNVRASRSDHEAAEKEDTRQLLDKLSEYRKNRLSNTNTNSSVSNITDTTDSGISTVHSQDSSMASKEKAKKTSGAKNNPKDSTSKAKKNGEQPQQPPKPDYSSIVSDLFNGQIIGQVQCLECKHLSTTTETFQHLSLPIPSKEYLQALHSKVVNHQNLRSNGPNDGDEEDEDSGSRRGAEGSDEMSSSVPYQSWLSWMVDVMKGYIWVRNTAEAFA